MFGKRNHRMRAFSTCHAAVLAVFIVLAHLLSLVSPSARLQASDQDVNVPVHPANAVPCEQTTESGSTEGCVVLLKTTQDEADSLVPLRFGLRL